MALRMYSAMVFGLMRLACIRKRKRAGGTVDEDRLSEAEGLGCQRIAGYRWGY